MKNKKNLSMLICLLAVIFSSKNILAQERVIPLDQSIPLSWEWNVEEAVINANPNKRIVYNVVKPSLLYFPAKNNTSGTSVIIAPGGALQVLSIDNEGVEVAKYLNDHGIDALVLKYSLIRTKSDNPFPELQENFFKSDAKRDSMISLIIPYAMKDGLSAISYVRKNATEFGLNPDKIGFMGFSAGGTVTMSVVYNGTKDNRPNFIAAIYPWIGEIGEKVPTEKTPAFIVVANDDALKLVPQSLKIFNKWNDANQPVELHVFGKGGHGFGVDKNNVPSDGWINLFIEWIEEEIIHSPDNP
jgi:acetyl esterase/lipase